MKEISKNQLTLIGEGGVGWVYKKNDEQIIKVFKDISLQRLEEQKKWARELFKAGVPTAISFETVLVDGNYGIVYELLNSTTVGQMVNDHPEMVDKAAELMGELLMTTHSSRINAPDSRQMKDIVIKLAYSMKDAGFIKQKDINSIKEILDIIPDSNCILHGDFHEGNVMTMKDEFLLIDIDDSCVGHPLFEFTLHYINHELLSKKPDLLYKSVRITPKTACRMAKLTREYCFKHMDPGTAELCRSLYKAMIPMMLLVIPAKAVNNKEFFDKNNQMIFKYVILPLFRITKHSLKNKLKKLKALE